VYKLSKIPEYSDKRFNTNDWDLSVGFKIPGQSFIFPMPSSLVSSIDITASIDNHYITGTITIKNHNNATFEFASLTGVEEWYISVRPKIEDFVRSQSESGKNMKYEDASFDYIFATDQIVYPSLSVVGAKTDQPISISLVDIHTARMMQQGTVNAFIPTDDNVGLWLKKFISQKFHNYDEWASAVSDNNPIGRWVDQDTKFLFPYQFSDGAESIMREAQDLITSQNNGFGTYLWRNRDGKYCLDTMYSLINNHHDTYVRPLVFKNMLNDGVTNTIGHLAGIHIKDATISLPSHQTMMDTMSNHRLVSFDPSVKAFKNFDVKVKDQFNQAKNKTSTASSLLHKEKVLDSNIKINLASFMSEGTSREVRNKLTRSMNEDLWSLDVTTEEGVYNASHGRVYTVTCDSAFKKYDMNNQLAGNYMCHTISWSWSDSGFNTRMKLVKNSHFISTPVKGYIV
jgi:hypothetical protein